jgi:hypothetical protein
MLLETSKGLLGKKDKIITSNYRETGCELEINGPEMS